MSTNGILLAKTVVNTNCPTIPLRFFNLTGFLTKLYKEQTAALCDEVSVEAVSAHQKHEDNEQSLFTTKIQETEDMPLPEHLQQMYNSSIKNLSKEQAKQVTSLLLKHTNVFSKSKSDLGNCGVIPH